MTGTRNTKHRRINSTHQKPDRTQSATFISTKTKSKSVTAATDWCAKGLDAVLIHHGERENLRGQVKGMWLIKCSLDVRVGSNPLVNPFLYPLWYNPVGKTKNSFTLTLINILLNPLSKGNIFHWYSFQKIQFIRIKKLELNYLHFAFLKNFLPSLVFCLIYFLLYYFILIFSVD